MFEKRFYSKTKEQVSDCRLRRRLLELHRIAPLRDILDLFHLSPAGFYELAPDGHLVEQRLEQVVILSIKENDASCAVVECLAKRQVTETRAQNDNEGTFGFHLGTI